MYANIKMTPSPSANIFLMNFNFRFTKNNLQNQNSTFKAEIIYIYLMENLQVVRDKLTRNVPEQNTLGKLKQCCFKAL